MKRVVLLLLATVLVACSKPIVVDDRHNINHNDDEKRADEKITMPLDEVKEWAFFSAPMTTNGETKDLYVRKLPERETINEHVFNNFIFMLADPNEDHAVVQTNLAIYEEETEILDFHKLDDIRFDTTTLDGQTILTLIESVDDQTNELMMWTIENGFLTEITFDKQLSITSIRSNNVFAKFINDRYMQTLAYIENTNNVGWYFTTWEFQLEELSFNSYYEKDYTNAEEFGLDTGEYIANKWTKFDEYYSEFPQYTFTKNDTNKLLNGVLLDAPFPLGTPIDQITDEFTFFEEGYYDGGPYYEIADAVYYYNERTNASSVVSVSGDRLINPHELEEILGKPKSSGRNDMYPDEIYSLYEWEHYTLWIAYDEDKKLKYIELHSKKHK